MPLYEYECESCGARFERFQSVQDEPIRVCPDCSGHVHKVFYPAGIIFKGSGWYITDSRKASSSSVTGDSKPSNSDGKSETKEAAKPTAEKTEKPKAETK